MSPARTGGEWGRRTQGPLPLVKWEAQVNCLYLYFLGQPPPSSGAQSLVQTMTQQFLYRPKEMGGNRIRTANLNWTKGVFCTILHHTEGVLKEVGIHFTLFSCSGDYLGTDGGKMRNCFCITYYIHSYTCSFVVIIILFLFFVLVNSFISTYEILVFIVVVCLLVCFYSLPNKTEMKQNFYKNKSKANKVTNIL